MLFIATNCHAVRQLMWPILDVFPLITPIDLVGPVPPFIFCPVAAAAVAPTSLTLFS
jgi:hypothetical protein